MCAVVVGFIWQSLENVQMQIQIELKFEISRIRNNIELEALINKMFIDQSNLKKRFVVPNALNLNYIEKPPAWISMLILRRG